jgi:hypothetical protein
VQWAALLKWGKPGGLTEHVLQALPGVMASAAIAALGSGGDPLQAAKGAAVAALAPLWHHLLKALPGLPYRGAMGLSVDGPTSRRIVSGQLGELVDEPDIVAIPATARVILNGTERTVPTPCSYEDLVDRAGKLGYPSMTLKSGNSGRIVGPGDVVQLKDGDKISVMHTGDA